MSLTLAAAFQFLLVRLKVSETFNSKFSVSFQFLLVRLKRGKSGSERHAKVNNSTGTIKSLNDPLTITVIISIHWRLKVAMSALFTLIAIISIPTGTIKRGVGRVRLSVNRLISIPTGTIKSKSPQCGNNFISISIPTGTIKR